MKLISVHSEKTHYFIIEEQKNGKEYFYIRGPRGEWFDKADPYFTGFVDPKSKKHKQLENLFLKWYKKNNENKENEKK